METTNRKNLMILAFTLVVVMLGFGMVIPLVPFYIEKLGASGKQLGWLIASYSLLRLIFAPVWGSLSDRLGRKPVLMVGILGNGLFLLLFGLATELWMLFVARGMAGILSSATHPAIMAYISDSTPEDERGSGMGKLGAAMGLGIILGPGLGGWLAVESLATPFFVAAGLSLVSFLLIFLLLPESLPAVARQQALTKPPGGSKVRRMVFLPNLREGKRLLWQALYSPIGILLFMAFLVSFGMTNFEGIFGLYALEKFGYDPQRVGTIMVVMGIVTAVVQGGLTGPLTKKWGETAVIKTSLLASSVGFGVMLLATTYATVLLTVGFFILTVALLRPAVLSLTSKRTTVGQGMAMGLNNSFMSLGRIVGPIWAGYLFDVNFDYPYVTGSVVMFIGFLVALVWVSPGKEKQMREVHHEVSVSIYD